MSHTWWIDYKFYTVTLVKGPTQSYVSFLKCLKKIWKVNLNDCDLHFWQNLAMLPKFVDNIDDLLHACKTFPKVLYLAVNALPILQIFPIHVC